MRWAGHVSWMGENRLLEGKPERMRPLRRPRRRQVDNIKLDLGEIGWSGVDSLVWLRIGTCWERLWIRWWNFVFHKMLGNYRVASQL
jgi:hypothetical protein